MVVCAVLNFCTVSEAQTPNIPQIPQPLHPSRIGGSSSITNRTFSNPTKQIKMGATANDLLKQAQAANPYYGYGNTPAENQKVNEARIRMQMANDPAYNPSLRNATANRNMTHKNLEILLQDIIIQENQRIKSSRQTGPDYKPDKSPSQQTMAYSKALDALKDMLTGKRNISLADAYFLMEDAFGDPYLNEGEYKKIINQSVQFIKKWMTQNSLNTRDNSAINYAVQQFMGKEIHIYETVQNTEGLPAITTKVHKPFLYDYIDYAGEKDHRNYFLTKCLATGMGQCNSLPAVYLVLVEALGGKAHLAMAPQHALIKYPDKDGTMRNYEPTSNWVISDQWYLEHLFITPKAIASGIYLTPYNKKQIIADIVLQLTYGYFRKFGAADHHFIHEAINLAKSQFPKDNNIAVYFSYSNLYAYQLAQVMRKHSIPTVDDIARYPEAQNIYKKWVINEQKITQLGYQEIPEALYETMLRTQEFRGQQQEELNIDGKVKRSQFIHIK